MMLSSTIRTLIGGMAPSSRPAGSFGLVLAAFFGFLGFAGRGDATRGGVVAWSMDGCPSEGIRGLGSGGGAGTVLDCVLRLSWVLVLVRPKTFGEAVSRGGYPGLDERKPL